MPTCISRATRGKNKRTSGTTKVEIKKPRFMEKLVSVTMPPHSCHAAHSYALVEDRVPAGTDTPIPMTAASGMPHLCILDGRLLDEVSYGFSDWRLSGFLK